MSWKVEYTPGAEMDVDWFRKNDRKEYLKCLDLVRSVTKAPFGGIGRPEPLKHLGPNIWSRRVNLEDRMVCTVGDGIVVVSAFRFHY